VSEDVPNPFDRVVEPWEGVIEDMEAIAAEFREAEWDVLELHPGDVATLDGSGREAGTGGDEGEGEAGGDGGNGGDDTDGADTASDTDTDRFGLEVLVPDPEFEQLESWIEKGTRFGSYEVYRTTENGVVFLLVVLTDEATERAVCVPAYYESEKASALRERAEREGVFFTYVRRLRRDRVITFTGDDPDFFLPE
jgi:hypothetical protein